MMRNKVSSALQKTYDECYLICSTAVYFEGQGNEAEALRSWRSALDQIYYHNAYKVPPGYVPKSETEKSLKDSLKDMELRCKERVDLLQALRQSREDENKADDMSTDESIKQRKSSRSKHKQPDIASPRIEKGFLGDGTIPAMEYPDLNRTRPPSLPTRPRYDSKTSSEYAVVGKKTSSPPRLSLDSRPVGLHATSSSSSLQPPNLSKKSSRSPSPEKRTMLHTLRNPDRAGKKSSSRSPRVSGAKKEDLVTNKAASLAWQSTNAHGSRGSRDRLGRSLDMTVDNSSTTLPDGTRQSSTSETSNRPAMQNMRFDSQTRTLVPDDRKRSEREAQHLNWSTTAGSSGLSRHRPHIGETRRGASGGPSNEAGFSPDLSELSPLSRPPLDHANDGVPPMDQDRTAPPPPPHGKPKFTPVGYPVYLDEYPETSAKKAHAESTIPARPQPPDVPNTRSKPEVPPRLPRKPVLANTSSPRQREKASKRKVSSRLGSEAEDSSSDVRDPSMASAASSKQSSKQSEDAILVDPMTPTSDESNTSENVLSAWELKVAALLKNLPKGVDEAAAKQIFNEIVVQGDEVHWEDVAGLDIAKKALKEAVVYPFLRPDLFMGLREPARGMLLFGPPGTGKTMLARAVATESRSTFFSISASSLTSKFLGESEKLVRALFALSKALAPSIIFVDEIDSLLSTRSGSGEHEATRRIKTEFLIQWSDLQRAAAGREQSDKEKERGDASRVLVLAATNLPWAIDEAARRRFVRRQYIPLPEDETRAVQLRTLLGHQKHSLSERDIQRLVALTDGFSGSDITALAKDAAMGPLRSLGEKLLEMTMDEIRPIQFVDFEASLVNIRPSVSKQGLKEFEDWAREFGERGG